MARLFKPTITRYVDPQGRRCKKGDPGAHKKRVKSKTWRGQYRDADGVTQNVKLCTNKPAAAQMLNDLVRRAEREQAGLVDPFEQHRKARKAIAVIRRIHSVDSGHLEQHEDLSRTDGGRSGSSLSYNCPDRATRIGAGQPDRIEF